MNPWYYSAPDEPRWIIVHQRNPWYYSALNEPMVLQCTRWTPWHYSVRDEPMHTQHLMLLSRTTKNLYTVTLQHKQRRQKLAKYPAYAERIDSWNMRATARDWYHCNRRSPPVKHWNNARFLGENNGWWTNRRAWTYYTRTHIAVVMVTSRELQLTIVVSWLSMISTNASGCVWYWKGAYHCTEAIEDFNSNERSTVMNRRTVI